MLWWFAAASWTGVIFLTLPYVPVWRDWTAEHLGESFIFAVVAGILVFVLAATIVRFVRRKASIRDYVFLGLIVAGYAYSLSRIVIVVEQVHFVEYGVLACFIISALRVDGKDSGQYLNSLLLITLVGVADEYVQGHLANRVGELHDVYLNILSGGLALLWFRFCLKPTEMASNWRGMILFALPVVGLIILGIGVFNSRISEFGYLIKDPEIGEFYSRLPINKPAVGLPDSGYFKTEILPQLYHGPYMEMLRKLKGSLYGEVLVHIFSRDKHLEKGDMIAAFHENQILEKYFACYIIGTEQQWTDDRKAEVKKACEGDFDQRYVSPVSAQIITAFSETTQWIIIGMLEAVIIAGWFTLFLKRRWSNNVAKHLVLMNVK
jgi:hypothetical protein